MREEHATQLTGSGREPSLARDPTRGAPIATGPHPQAHPDALAIHAFARGVRPAHPQRCRVLALGCGDGVQLLGVASRLPGADMVGVEADSTSLAAAREGARALGLDHVILTDAIPEGRFDYVLAPDWLMRPGASTDRLDEVAAHLAPEGVAFVAHAIAPGRLLRDALAASLRQATSDASGAADARRVARRGLHALAAQVGGEPDPHAHAVALEVARALHADDASLDRRYLAPPAPIRSAAEFEADAAAAGLRQLAVLGPHTPDPRVDESLRLALAPHGPVAAVESWADLLQGRDERWVALVHEETAGRPAPSWADQLQHGELVASFVPEEPTPWLGPRSPVTFRDHAGRELTADEPGLKTALWTLGQVWPGGLRFEELLEEVAQRLARSAGGVPLDGEDVERLGFTLATLRRQGLVRSTLCAPVRLAPTEGPRVSPITRWEASRGAGLSNPYFDVLELEPAERMLVPRLDGRPIDEIWASVRDEVHSGMLVCLDETGQPVPTARAEAILEAALRDLLPRLAHSAILR